MIGIQLTAALFLFSSLSGLDSRRERLVDRSRGPFNSCYHCGGNNSNVIIIDTICPKFVRPIRVNNWITGYGACAKWNRGERGAELMVFSFDNCGIIIKKWNIRFLRSSSNKCNYTYICEEIKYIPYKFAAHNDRDNSA